MTELQALATDYWLENTKRIHDEDLHISNSIIEAYEAGFNKAKELAIMDLLHSIEKEPINSAFTKITMGTIDEINNLGTHEEV